MFGVPHRGRRPSYSGAMRFTANPHGHLDIHFGIESRADYVIERRQPDFLLRVHERKILAVRVVIADEMVEEPIPRPCKRFSKRRCLNERFLKHLPICPAWLAVILYLEKQSQIDRYVHQHRNW